MKFSFARLSLLMGLAFLLTILPIWQPLVVLKPFFVLLLLLYIQFMLNDVFNISWIIFCGLMLDVLCSTCLGQHVLALCLVAWCASSRAKRFKFFSISQQLIWISVLGGIYQCVLVGVSYCLGYKISLLAFCIPILTTMLCWLPVKRMAASFVMSHFHHVRSS